MKIEKYEYTKNNNYNIYLSNGEIITLDERVITKNELLLTKEIDTKLYNKLLHEDKVYKAVNTATKYILIRLRSKKEIKNYLLKKEYPINVIEESILKLEKDGIINDDIFTQAYIKDKLNFTTMGDYKIKLSLASLGIDNSIIEKNISQIDEELLNNKIIKVIEKEIRKNKKYTGSFLRNKIYNHLITQGYSKDKVLNVINNFEF